MHNKSLITILIIAFINIATATAREQAAVPGCEAEFTPVTGSYNFIKNMEQPPVAASSEIGKVYYTQLPVFDESDPDENNFLFRWANRFHPITREYVVDDLILFAQGQAYNSQQIAESARILRGQKYLYDANVRVVRSCEGKVDLEVVTRDIWSFNPEISYSRSGGASKHRFGIRDVNLFGTGKQLALASKKDSERTSMEINYKDPNISGSRVATRIVLADNDDGSDFYIGFALPFFSLETEKSWSLRLEGIDRIDTQSYLGKKVSEVHHDIEETEVSYGFSKGIEEGLVKRWSVGFGYRKDQFSLGDTLPPPAQLPMEKTLYYPFFIFDRLEDNFATAFNLDQIHRTEDLHVGSRFWAQVGYADGALGSDQERLIYKSGFSDTLIYAEGLLWQHHIKWSGLWNFETRKAEDMLLEYETRYFRGQTKHRSFVASFKGIYSKNLNTSEQIILGGETGLRGYDRKFQVGDRMILLNLEERMYTDLHPLNLFRFGWAVFIDAGKAWDPRTNNGTDNDLLVSAGFGLRLASSKANAGQIIHIDISFPLKHKELPGVDSRQFSVVIKDVF